MGTFWDGRVQPITSEAAPSVARQPREVHRDPSRLILPPCLFTQADLRLKSDPNQRSSGLDHQSIATIGVPIATMAARIACQWVSVSDQSTTQSPRSKSWSWAIFAAIRRARPRQSLRAILGRQTSMGGAQPPASISSVAASLRILSPATREVDCKRNTTKAIKSASEISKASTQTITSSFRPNIAVGCASEGLPTRRRPASVSDIVIARMISITPT